MHTDRCVFKMFVVPPESANRRAHPGGRSVHCVIVGRYRHNTILVLAAAVAIVPVTTKIEKTSIATIRM
jgi:hypothetical protein